MRNAIGIPAAASEVSPAGTGTTRAASVTTDVANVPAPTPITRSPTRERLDAGSERHDAARALAAQRPGVARVHAERVQHVAEVEPGGLDLDLDLSAARRRPFGRDPREVVEDAAPRDVQAQ